MAGTLRAERLGALSVDEVLAMRAGALWVAAAVVDPFEEVFEEPSWSAGELTVFSDAGWPSPPPTYLTRWGGQRLDGQSVAARLARAEMAAGWVRARHGLPMGAAAHHRWCALVGLWSDLDASEPLPMATLAWAQGRWEPGRSGHQGMVEVALDRSDAYRGARRPRRGPADRTDPVAVEEALVELFLADRTTRATRATCTQAALGAAYADWASDHWVVAPDRDAVVSAVCAVGGFARVSVGRHPGVAGMSLVPHPGPGPRALAHGRAREDLVRRIAEQAPVWTDAVVARW